MTSPPMNRKQRRAAKSKGNPAPGRPAPAQHAGPSIADRFAVALSHHQAGRLREAESLYRQICAADPSHVDSLHFLGVLAGQAGRNDIAIDLIGRALTLKPSYVEARYNLGKVLAKENRLDQAAAQYEQALALKPDYLEAQYNLGNVLMKQGRLDDAMIRFQRALLLKPDYAEAHNGLGAALSLQGKITEARACYERALALKPDFVDALHNLGNAFCDLGQPTQAIASFDKALAIEPAHIEALNNRGNALQRLKRPAEALASFERALAIKPDYPDALNNRGLALRDLQRPAEEALASFDRALAIRPDFAEALNNRGNALQDLQQYAPALASYDGALTIKPEYGDALYNRGSALRRLNRFAEALASFDQALAIIPDHPHAFSEAAEAALAMCNWSRTAMIAGELATHIARQKSIVSPFFALGYGCDPSLQLECARRFIEDKLPVRPQPLWKGAIRHHDKIRISYLSADFHRHATAFLTAGLFELHDRARFEVIGMSFGPDEQGDMRTRLMSAFDEFHDVRSKSDLDIAKHLNELHVDIAIDLKGYTYGARFGIFAHRPAPIQVSYLGYPGTMGADFIDYLIADETVLPFDQQPYYTEKIVHLPDCYQVNDSKREIPARTPARRGAGLPEEGFVFCCFNNNYKITPPVFDVWMRLLAAVGGSVLWLFQDNGDAPESLRREAAARGIDPARLVFAPRVGAEEHLARHRLADLFLDTLPYNAHTTASDALWAGLPVLTCRGASFAGRVAASLLYAAGLPELAAGDLGEYEALALRLATDAALLRGYRHRLEQNRATCPLFDTDRFRRHIEEAYTTMWEIHRRGESPRSFAVASGE
jgi:protein O-GlcNAc transferase